MNEIRIRIAEILKLEDKKLLDLLTEGIQNLQNIDKTKAYNLSFSGGKDSHVLMGLYFLYLKLGFQAFDIAIVFSDTHLEHHKLYKAIELAKSWSKEKEIEFKIVSSEKSYWFYQYVYGYPVPDYRTRWCTGKLKISPLENSGKIPITGRHLGESKARDRRLKKSNCSTNDCGISEIKSPDKIEPIVNFRNCNIWDCLFYFDGVVLYEGCFNLLKETYQLAEDEETGSLRLGCFMCPVIAISTIKKNVENGIIADKSFKIRLELETLRNARRIKSPKTGKNGAILIYDRRKSWEELDKEFLLANKWITQSEIEDIDKALVSKYSYPPTYKKKWIDFQHKIITESVEIKQVKITEVLALGTYFTGGGLYDFGAKQAGLEPVWGVEWDERLKVIHEPNFPESIIHWEDVSRIDPYTLPKVDILHFSPSCIRFSQANINGSETKEDMLSAIAISKAIEAIKPRFITLENVRQYKNSESFKLVFQALCNNGYWVQDFDIDFADYGNPSHRERLFLVAFKTEGKTLSLPSLKPSLGWYAAIEDLIPKFESSYLTGTQKKKLSEKGLNLKKLPLSVIKRNQIRSTISTPAYTEPCFTITAKIATDHKFSDRRKFMNFIKGKKVLNFTSRAIARLQGVTDDFLLTGKNNIDVYALGNGVPSDFVRRFWQSNIN
ncbi:DNA cytosine methyltransferase [Okeania sp. SIO2B9]|uniref:DNA cytosine methyltransferase n=1 Tax=Okeania sp. SIO2B9 TaxID=2607782 RepID=UPI00142C58F3|nr:DNA cytosine methyltransferase [Okeania sp. SIO2B9]NES92765.1 phosphoadenosine phosphosulfate reductase family protein [Okeania sp. SIO2B9]